MHSHMVDFLPAKYESITVSSTATGFTGTNIKPTSGAYTGLQCKAVFVTVESANIRFCVDGTTATTTVGHKLSAGEDLTLRNPMAIKNFSAIRDDSTDATIHVTYFF